MRALRKLLVVAAVAVGVVAVGWLALTPGALATPTPASDRISPRDMLAAMVGLVVLGMIALGFGFEDML